MVAVKVATATLVAAATVAVKVAVVVGRNTDNDLQSSAT